MKLVVIIAIGIVLAEILKTSAGALILPFVIPFIFAKIFRPLGVRLSKVCRIKERVGCAVFAVLICFGAVYTVASVSASLISEVKEIEGMSEIVSEVSGTITKMFDSLPFHWFGEADKVRDAVVSQVGELLSHLGSFIASVVGEIAKALPSSMLSLFIGAAAFVYLMADMDGIGEGIVALLPEDKRDGAVRLFNNASEAVFGCVKAYLQLGVIVFFALLIGFLILGIPGRGVKALLIAVLDALPLFGCGIVLIPWGIYKIIAGDLLHGVGLIVLYVLIWALRQILEPRLLGRMMGVNPFIMLAVMYLGWKTGGFTGMILLSVAVMVRKNMSENTKDPPDDGSPEGKRKCIGRTSRIN